MRVKLICAGRTEDLWIKQGISSFISRLKHYVAFDVLELPAVKEATADKQKEKEWQLIQKHLPEGAYIVLLDEQGKEYSSREFAVQLEKLTISGRKNIAFIIGGPFGFPDEAYAASSLKLSLSRMTFTHQMVRLFFVEQLYRAFTIIRGEKYHHD